MHNPHSSTVSAEFGRSKTQQGDKTLFKNLQRIQGVITEIHPTMPMVKVIDIKGAGVLGGAFIPVINSVLDIIHRFGALRPGMKVVVTYTGDSEQDALAEIIASEEEKVGLELQVNNQVETPIYAIYKPGI